MYRSAFATTALACISCVVSARAEIAVKNGERIETFALDKILGE